MRRPPIVQRPTWRRLPQCLTWEDMAPAAKLMGYEPHPAQLEIHMDRTRFREAICGRRFGKSKMAAFEAAIVAICGGWSWALGPTYELAAVVFDESLEMISGSDFRSLILSYSNAKGSKEIFLSTGGRIISKSSDRAQSLLGRGLDFVVFDEAAEESDPTIQQQRLRPALTDRMGSELIITTPLGEDDWVADMFRRGQDPEFPNWKSWRMASVRNTSIPGLSAEIEEARLEIPESVYRQQYLAEFGAGVGAVFRGFRDIATLNEGEGEGPFVFGLDLARDVDFTVLVILCSRTGNVVHIDRWNRIDWELQEGRVAEIVESYRCVGGVIDRTGVGSRVFELIQGSLPWCTVEGYQFTHLTKATVINQLAVAIEQKALHLLNEEIEMGRLAIGELSAYRFIRTEAGNIKMSAPPGRHDDIVTALALAYEAAQRFGGTTQRMPAGPKREVTTLSGTYGRPLLGRSRPARRRFWQMPWPVWPLPGFCNNSVQTGIFVLAGC